jgi:DNA-binding transcriptional LysR family regulator
MNLHLLRLFHAVVEHRGFSRAAEALFITQSAVSKGVRELERQLELPLIAREAAGPRGSIQLTDAGQSLYEHARGIFALERAATDEMRQRTSLQRGRLRIGASTTIASYWLGDALARFATAHPGIELALRVGNTGETCRRLLDCEIDLAYVEGAVDDPRIEATPWKLERLVPVTAADSGLGAAGTVAIDELHGQTWLLREAGSGTGEVAASLLEANGIRPAHVVEIGSNEAIASAVATGVGVSILPEAVVADAVAAGRLRVFALETPASLTRTLFRLQMRERPPSNAALAFLDLA